MCQHTSDQIVYAQCQAFPASHGKCPCDGIGGGYKHGLVMASLHRSKNNSIMIFQKWSNFVKPTWGLFIIELFNILEVDIQEHLNKCKLKHRWKSRYLMQRSLSYHCFMPTNLGVEITHLSEGSFSTMLIIIYKLLISAGINFYKLVFIWTC